MGIVTQTSLLRIFDPMEMYGVIENMQQTIQQINPNSINDTEAKFLSSQDRISSTDEQSEKLISICTTIEYLIDNLEISKEEQRSLLQSILENLSDSQ